MNYYPFHIGDYAVHTRHLSLMEDLAYRRLLDLYYTREFALPSDVAQVARLIGMRDHAPEVASVLAEFFVPSEEGDWIHMRCEDEIKKVNVAAERARTNGKKGGRPANNPVGSQSVRSGNPEITYSQAPNTQDPVPNTQREEEANASLSAKPTTPPCPIDKIIETYHDALPSLPRATLKVESRNRALRKFWGWVLTSKRSDGAARAEGPAEALEWIRSYFARASENDFLMGRGTRSSEHANWRCDLDFLLTDRGKKQVIEKTQVDA